MDQNKDESTKIDKNINVDKSENDPKDSSILSPLELSLTKHFMKYDPAVLDELLDKCKAKYLN